MSLLNAVLSNAGIVDQLGKQFGLNSSQTSSAIAAMLPALTGGVGKNVKQDGGLQSLMSALKNGNHQQYIDNPASLGQLASVNDGNAILGHLLGGKDVSRAVASNASQKTGLGDSILKQMLPLIATAVMGAISKQATGSASGASANGLLGGIMSALSGNKSGATGSGDMMGMITGFLDADGDGSALDEIMGMLTKQTA